MKCSHARPGRPGSARPAAAAALAAALIVSSCTGSVDPAGAIDTPAGSPGQAPGAPPPSGAQTPGKGGGVAPPPGGTAAPAPARVRRLTGTELRNAMNDLFLPGRAVELPFPSEGTLHKFETRYDGLGVPLPLAEALQTGSERVAEEAVKDLPALLACRAQEAEEACVGRFVETYGRRAWRRPLAPAEAARLLGVFKAVRAEAPSAAGVAAVIQALLQSPHFLFRSELGEAPGRPQSPLAPYELASALSFLIWQSGPDEPLLEAARAGQLATPAGIEAQARRLFADARGRRAIRAFVDQWLETGSLASVTLNPKSYPQIGPALVASLEREFGAFVDAVAAEKDGVRALLTANGAVVDAAVARLYGLTDAPAGTATKATALDRAQRAGFLTRPAFLMAHAAPTSFSPVFLGLFVRRKALCSPLGDPPPDIPALPEPKPGVSPRDRYAMHAASPACAGCHEAMDPIGFGFERYDALGKYRETDGGFRLTGEGRLVGTDVDGPFQGPVELATKLAGSAQFLDCFVGQLYEYALGRDAAMPGHRLPVDTASIARTVAGLRERPAALGEIFAAVATSDSFRFRDTRALPAGGDR